MNKLFTKIAALALGATMAVGVGVAVASSGKEAAPVSAATIGTNLVQVTSITSGNQYVITGANNTYALPTKPTVSSGKIVGTAIASVPADGTGFLWTITKSGNYYLIGDGSKYIYHSNGGASGTNLAYGTSQASYPWDLKYSTSTQAHWTLKGVVASSSTVGSRGILYQKGTVNKFGGYAVSNETSTDYGYMNIYEVASTKALSSIALSGSYQTTFTVGDTFNHTGMVVTATYSDSSTADVTSSATFSGYNMSTTGNQTVTVSYTEGGTTKTTTYSITVNAPKTPASVSSSGQATTFDDGNTFAYGGTLTATYTDSTSKTVSPTSFKIGNAGINPTSAGTVITPGSTTLSRDDHNGKTVYVLYTENNTTVYTSYVITVNVVSSVTFTYGTDNTTGSTMTKSGATLTIGTPGTDGTFDTNNNNCYKIYKNKTLVVSSTRSIAKVEFTCTASGTSQYGPGCLTADVGSYTYSGTEGTWTGSATSITFTASTNQVRPTLIKVTFASTDPLVELDASSATSVSMMKGDTDTTVKVHVLNITTKTWTFTFDEGGSTGLSTSAYINVSAGAAVSDVHTLSITTKAVGSTTMHIAVSGTACETAVPVTVNAKPASMEVVHGQIHEGVLEVITGKYKDVSFSGEDTDGNAYAIAAGDVTPSATSGASHVTLSGSRITGASEGDAVVRYTLNALTSVYAEITVHVVDDYIETVGEPTFATGLADTQGQSPTVSVFTSRPGTLHSGESTTVPFENYKFSYDSTYASSEYGSVFSYDFSHGTTIDSTHKLQTIYVFCDIDEAAHGSYTVTVEQFNDPLTAITFTNPNDHDVDVTRGDTFQLEWAYTPTDPTDGKEVEFIIDDNDDGIGITVSSTGLISISASSGLGTALVLIQSAHDDTIQDYVYVTAVLESMKYTVSEEESLTPVSTVSSGDRVYMVATATDHSNATYEFSGYPGTYGGATAYTTTVAKLQLLIVEAGTESGTVAFKLSGGDNDGEYISYSGSSNTLNHTSTKDKSASWTVDGSTITNANTTARQMWLNWNNGTPRFACYTNKTSTTGYYCPTFIKVTGGDVEMDVTETLFNAIHNNFGEDKTYEWSESCPAFDDGAWTDACEVVLDLTDYEDYKLNRAVANLSGNEIEVFLAKYDVIIGKFGTDYDYLERFTEGGINYGARIGNINPISIIGAKSDVNVIAIVVITSVVSLTAIGGYFFLRKRREQN